MVNTALIRHSRAAVVERRDDSRFRQSGARGAARRRHRTQGAAWRWRRRSATPGEDALARRASSAPSMPCSPRPAAPSSPASARAGHIARKIAATLASTGQPAAFVHPAEASHGDLGMVQNGDVVLALSWSGESVELAAIVTYAKRFAIPLIAMTSQADSALGRQADIVCACRRAQEACPNGLAPTTSTTMQLALGDALGDGAAGGQGFHRARFSRPASRRQARRQARLRARHHAQGRRRSRASSSARRWRRRSSR